MSLDMYILKKYYVGANYDHRKVTGTIEIYERDKKLNINFNEVRHIECEAIHWESMDFIHNWFVYFVQGGEDDCKQYYVERKQLKELLNTCNKILENRELAEDLLPTEKEFYFENGTYNETYFDNLEMVVGTLSKLDIAGDDYSFEYYYESAW